MSQLTKEDINKVFEVCDPMEKAVILLMLSIKADPREITRLKLVDFIASISRNLKDPENVRKVSGDWIVGYNIESNSLEGTTAIVDYLNWRAKNGPIYLDESLFVNADGEPLYEEDIHFMFHDLNNKASLEKRTFTVQNLNNMDYSFENCECSGENIILNVAWGFK